MFEDFEGNGLYLYRVLTIDDEGDPLDHGVVVAASPADAARELRLRFHELGILWEPVRLYPLKAGTGVLESAGAWIDLEPCRSCGALLPTATGTMVQVCPDSACGRAIDEAVDPQA